MFEQLFYKFYWEASFRSSGCGTPALDCLLEFSLELLRQSIDCLAGFTLEKKKFRILRELLPDLFAQLLIRLVVVPGERAVALEPAMAGLPFFTWRGTDYLFG